MASTAIIQRRNSKIYLEQNPPRVGEIIYAIDTDEFGTNINGTLVWKNFTDLVKSVAGKTGHVTLTKDDFGLNNVDNTSDINKPISLAQQTEFNNKLNIGGKAADSILLDGKPPSFYIGNGGYSQAEIDALLDYKSDKTDVYTKIIINDLLDYKADKLDTYTKLEVQQNFESKSNKSAINGYASLDVTGKVPLTELPTFSTSAYESYPDIESFPASGINGLFYVANNTGALYIWNGSQYVSSTSGDNSYIRNTPTDIQVGVLPSGSTLNGTVQDVFDRIFYTFNTPSFSTFDISGMPTQIEYDETIPSGGYNFTWNSTFSSNIKPNSINIYLNSTLLVANTQDDGIANIHLNELSSNITKTDIFKITGENTNNTVFEKTYNVEWISPIHEDTIINPDSGVTDEDNFVDINVINNDSSVEGVATLVSATNGTNGITTVLDLYNIRYTPNLDFYGTDIFTYTNTEGNSGTVTVTINPINDNTVIVNDNVSTLEDTFIDIDVLSNDTDPDTKSPVQTITQPLNGVTSINQNGTIKYTPNLNFNGVDTFVYKNIENNTGSVIVTVILVNDETIIVADTASTTEDNFVDIDVISNDDDIDSNNSVVSSVTNGTNGTVTIINTSTVRYNPNLDFNGTDTFTYTNAEGNVGIVTVTISAIVDNTVIVNDVINTQEDTAITFNPTLNDNDVDSAVSNINTTTQPLNGIITRNANEITYTPSTSFNGTDTFTYTNTEGTTGTININVSAVNDPTTVVDDVAVTDEDTSILINVLDNDIDVDAKSIPNTVTNGTNGTTTIEGDKIRYTPNLDFNGVDTFTYTNTEGNSGTVTITINAINDNTVVVNDVVTTNEDTQTSFDPTLNDTDVENTVQGIGSITQPLHGVASLTGNTITYTPELNFNGSDTMTYLNLEGTTGVINITVTPVNDATDVVNDNGVSQEDTAVIIDVLTNDTDVDDKATIISVTQGTNGTTLIENNKVKYTPNLNFNGVDVFTYTNSEGNTGTVTVTIAAVDDETIIINDAVTTQEDTAITFNPTLNDDDVDSVVENISTITQPINGVATLSNNSITYTPNTDFNGTDTLTYTNTGNSVGSITVTVTPVDDETIIVEDNTTTIENNSVIVDVLSNDTDVDTKATLVSVTTPLHGTAVIENSKITYTPTNGYYGTDSFIYTNSEGNSGTVTVTISHINIPTVVVNDIAVTDKNVIIDIDVLFNDSDSDGPVSIVSQVSTANHGSTQINPNGTIKYTPDNDYFGNDTFTYTNEENTVGVVNITVNNVIVPITEVLYQLYIEGIDEDESGPVSIDSSYIVNNSNIISNITSLANMPGNYIFDITTLGLYDNLAPNYDSSKTGFGAYASFAYPVIWGQKSTANFLFNGAPAGFVYDVNTYTINSIEYQVITLANPFYAEDDYTIKIT